MNLLILSLIAIPIDWSIGAWNVPPKPDPIMRPLGPNGDWVRLTDWGDDPPWIKWEKHELDQTRT